jgi:CheY-like chemotaxis protein
MNDKKANLLLVDDDANVLWTVGDQLALHGYEVHKAKSAEDALTRLKHLKPDLIILDIAMPGVGGLGFLRRITDLDGGTQYPVLVFTARAELGEFFGQSGVDGFLPKTVDPAKLLTEVERILRQKQAPAVPRRDPSRRRLILLAECDTRLSNRLINYLLRNGFDVGCATSGHQALEQAVQSQPDAILVKYFMPHMNGPSIAGNLAAMNSTRHIPVILYDDTGTHRDSLDLPNVRTFVRSSAEDLLLNAIKAVTAPVA